MAKKTKLKIVMVASEVVPFAKTGGLADVAGALPKVLKELGNEAVIFMPKYKIARENAEKKGVKIEKIGEIEVKTNGEIESAGVEKATYNGVDFYFVDAPKYFDRDGLYQDPNTKTDYDDNLKRYSFFSRAVIEGLKFIDYKPNIIHTNDWQTALIPVYLKTIYRYDNFFNGTKTVYTIHNLAYQGLFPAEQYPIIGLDWKYFTVSGLEFYGKLNLMKGGLVFADILNTVSETYAQEIQTPEFGYGLEGVLRVRAEQGDLYGIVNGVDYSEWDPRNDPYIKEAYGINYDDKSVEKKYEIKSKFIKELGLDKKVEKKLLIGIVSRLADQKGFDLIYDVADEMMKLDIGLVVLGTGKPEYEDKFRQLEKSYPDRVKAIIGFNIPMSHKIEAASDAFLMPSRFEPCGLNQLYSLRYGTLPIVRATGGLNDTVKDGKTGFQFKDYTGEALLKAIKKAVDTYYKKPDKWRKMMLTAMKEDWSWKTSAKKYVDLYKKALSK